MRIRGLLYSVSVAAVAVSFAPAYAQQASGGIEEVVVTAEKRPERLKDAPVAISVVSTKQLSDANATDIADLNNLVPSVQLNGTINGRVPYGVRGISTDSNEQTVGIASGVAVMIDGVPVSSDSYDANHMEDIQQVEVLKGPQATLGGRTAAAGEINFVTRGPSDTFTGTFSVTATDRMGIRGNGFIAGPISDTLEYSLSGYDDHTIFPITNLATGKRTDEDAYGGRGKLKFQPTENFDATLAVHLAHSQSHGDNFVYLYATPGATLLGTPPPAGLTQANLLAGVTPSFKNEKYNSSVPNAGLRLYDADVSLDMNYRFGDVTLSSTTAYQNERQRSVEDLFTVASIDAPAGYGPPTPIGTSNSCFNGGPQYFFQYLTHCTAPYYGDTQTNNQEVRQWSEELKLVSSEDGPFSWLVGGFFSDTTVTEDLDRPFVGAWVDVNVKPETKTYDVYGRATWKFTPETWLVGGLRYNYDELNYNYNQTHYVLDNVDQGAQTSTGSDNSSAIVGDVSLQHHFSDEGMVYATYARGYAPKVYNTSLALTASGPNELTPASQEHIDNYELGSKGIYFDGRLSLDADLFYTRYQGYQIQTFDATPGVTFPQLILINGGARTEGAELDSAFQATDSFSVNFNAAYIDAEFTQDPAAPCYPSTSYPATGSFSTCPLAGNTFDAKRLTLPNSPKFKFNLGADEKIPFDFFDLSLRANYSYRTKAQMLADQNPEAIQHAFGLLNLSVTAATKSGGYALTAFVNNVTDKHYYTDVEDFWGAPWGGNNMVIGEPAKDATRYMGLRLDINF
jgi:iron complex outermembrane receptor protein